MKKNDYFQNHHKRLMLEAAVKSALCGLMVGFGAAFIMALLTWATPIDGIGMTLAVFAIVTLIASPIFYFTLFRLTDMNKARRLDSLGLEERMITMVELSENDSYMAEIQRNDAQKALSKVDSKQIKIRVQQKTLVSLIVCACLAVGMTTASVLAEFGFIPKGDDIIDSFVEDQMTEWVTITYIIEEGGVIDGDEDQIIVKGTNATPIVAIADDGYVFKGWSDGSTDPFRNDREITEDIVYVAEFTELGDEEGDGDGDGDGEGEGDESDDTPKDPEEGNNGNNEPGKPGDQSQGAMGGGKNDPNNQIIDGETYYRDVLESYQDSAGEFLQNENSGLSEYEKELIKKYLGIV